MSGDAAGSRLSKEYCIHLKDECPSDVCEKVGKRPNYLPDELKIPILDTHIVPSYENIKKHSRDFFNKGSGRYIVPGKRFKRVYYQGERLYLHDGIAIRYNYLNFGEKMLLALKELVKI